ncbi:MAG TPA: sporulation protein YtfJ [Clostridiales bacterium]|nr:sporulation protein YtfJ [Clostridiales bacterium]
MADHPIGDIMQTTMENIKEMIDVNTIVGDAVETGDGTVIIPISKLSFGFVSGGSEFSAEGKDGKNSKVPKDTLSDGGKDKLPFGGGTGAGVSVQPVAFLVVGQGQIKLLPVMHYSAIDKVINFIPQLVEEVQGVLKKQDKTPIPNIPDPTMTNQNTTHKKM